MPIKDRERKNTYQRKYYASSKHTQDSAKRRAKIRRDVVSTWLREYKKQSICEKCGENHPACLEFHHVNPNNKEIEISRAVTNNWSINRLQIELGKCVCLCCNCHRKIHWRHSVSVPD